MTFKKIFKTKNRVKGQASLEYFILLSIITLISIISLSSFFPIVKAAGGSFFRAAVTKIGGVY